MNPKRKRRLKIAAAVRQIYEAADAGTEHYKSEDPDAARIACTRGCNACCKMQVVITGAEALAIAERHADFVKERLDELRAQTRIIEQLCAKRLPPKKQGMMTPEESDAIASDWWALQLPCPLLLENGDCGVYESRPLPCRTHFVVTEPALCTKVPRVVIGHWVPLHRDDVYQRMIEAWFEYVGHNRWPIGSLAKMVLTAYNERKATL